MYLGAIFATSVIYSRRVALYRAAFKLMVPSVSAARSLAPHLAVNKTDIHDLIPDVTYSHLLSLKRWGLRAAQCWRPSHMPYITV